MIANCLSSWYARMPLDSPGHLPDSLQLESPSMSISSSLIQYNMPLESADQLGRGYQPKPSDGRHGCYVSGSNDAD